MSKRKIRWPDRQLAPKASTSGIHGPIQPVPVKLSSYWDNPGLVLSREDRANRRAILHHCTEAAKARGEGNQPAVATDENGPIETWWSARYHQPTIRQSSPDSRAFQQNVIKEAEAAQALTTFLQGSILSR